MVGNVNVGAPYSTETAVGHHSSCALQFYYRAILTAQSSCVSVCTCNRTKHRSGCVAVSRPAKRFLFPFYCIKSGDYSNDGQYCTVL